MTVKLKLRRAWVIHFASGRFAVGVAVPLLAWLNIDHWLAAWAARIALVVMALISIEFVSFKWKADGGIRYWKYVAFIPVYWTDVPDLLRLIADSGDVWEFTASRIDVRPYSSFACDKPEEVIAWLREKLQPLPEARVHPSTGPTSTRGIASPSYPPEPDAGGNGGLAGRDDRGRASR